MPQTPRHKVVVQIDKGIVIPPSSLKLRGVHCRLPFAQMEVGDSFAVSMTQTSAFTSASQWAARRRDGRKFTTRLLDDGRVRVWRTA